MLKYSQSTRAWLLASTVLASLCLTAPLRAQETTPPPAPEPEATPETPTLIVTGTRIKNKEYVSTAPVQIITSERSTAAGLISPTEILQGSTTAASSGQVNNTFTGFVVGGGGGINTVSLRGLGAQRSLVMLNGRRMPPAGVGGTVGPVDLNTLPSAMISRYEILKDGASSIYGSDAVAGVVNVITRKNFEGFEVNARANVTEHGGGGTQQFGAIWGKSFDKGRLTISAQHYEAEELTAGDRPGFECATDNYYIGDQRADIIDPTTGTYKCFSHGVEGYVPTYYPIEAFGGLLFFGSRGVAPGVTTNGVPGFAFIPYEQRSSNDPRAKTQTIFSPITNLTVFAEGEYRPDWAKGATLYSEGMYTKRNSRQQGWAQLFPIYHEQSTANPFRVGTTTIRSAIPNWPSATQTFAQLGYPGLAANPVVLYSVRDEQEVELLRLLGGVKGDWGKWSYDAYLSHSKSKASYGNDIVYADRVNHGTGTNQSTLELMPVCGPTAPAGCVPLDLFTKSILEDGQFPQAIKDYYFGFDVGHTTYTQTIAEATITGDLLTLPAGPMGVAAGVSIRHDEINDVPGPVAIARNAFSRTTAGITKGDDTLSEVFVEADMPLLKGLPFVQDLKLNVSARYSNYESIGSDTTYKVGLNWAVNDLLRLRATNGTSFRAPALYELFLEDQTGFRSQIQVDPCINYGATDSGGSFVKNERIRTNCAAEGLAPNFAGGSSDAQVTTGGGRDLKPEHSEASTFGIVLTPPKTGFKMALDLWKIRVNDQISASSVAIVGACYNSFDFPNNGFCNAFTRGPDDGILNIDAKYRNIPSQEVSGYDITLSYEKELNLGNLLIDANITHVNEYLSQNFPGDPINNFQGLIGEPEWVGNFTTQFKRKAWTYTWTMNVTGSTNNEGRFGETGVTDIFFAPGATYKTSTPNFFTHDLSVRYKAKTWEVTAAVSNLTDKAPPIVGNGPTIQRLGIYPLSSQYTEGYLGRQFFINLTKSF